MYINIFPPLGVLPALISLVVLNTMQFFYLLGSVISHTHTYTDSSFDHIYYIKTQPVARRESHKDLGILISEDLSWIKHYDYLQSKAYKKRGFLRRTLSKTMTIHTKKVLYTSLVRSQLTYCSPIWRPQFLKDIQSIENVQRRATKVILHDYKSYYKSRLVALHLLPLMMQFELIDILFFISSLRAQLLGIL